MVDGSALLHAIAGTPALNFVVTLLFHSLFVLLIFFLAEFVVKKLTKQHAGQYTPMMSHTLWRSAFIVLLALPLLPFLSANLLAALPGTALVSPIVEVVVLPEPNSQSDQFGFPLMVTTIYFSVTALLLLKLGWSYVRLLQLTASAQLLHDPAVHSVLMRRVQQLNIEKNISLLSSSKIDSPISFGMRRGVILLPDNYQQWRESAVTDVLMHELCHLRRNDWLTLMLTHILCALYWANPVVWLAQRSLLDATENRCDQDVVSHGRDQFIYAESLLGVASSCRQCQQRFRSQGLPAQPMFDRKTLKTRLNQVLKETTMKSNQIAQQGKKIVWGSSVFSLLILSVLAFNPILSAQDAQQQVAQPIDKEMLPVTGVTPYYPRKAADESIEGHATAQFTVDVQGRVVEDSITIIDAVPSDIFNQSAIAAVRQFQFQPHVINGQAVPVAEVEYKFNYRMKAE
ncbi:MAG: M56 family metallopeptidase [Pseudohongiella nitratireducens]|nr:M56 family metallopeptidase [Pseudohongiella nitratireducens]MDF1624556.1 M56 family metallopeptidase [Pseudohongiella nitratireducens]